MRLESFNLGHGYSLVIVTMPDGQKLASLGRDKGKDVMWTGKLSRLCRVVSIRDMH